MNDMSHRTCQAKYRWSRGKSLRGKDSRNSPCDPRQHPQPPSHCQNLSFLVCEMGAQHLPPVLFRSL